jgi:hypothetical protein
LFILFFVTALVLLWLFRKSQAPSNPERVSVAAVTKTKVQSAMQTVGAFPSVERLDARKVNAAMARKLIARSLRGIANAKSYKMVMTTSSHSGNGLIEFYASFTLVHERSQTRGDLFRMDTLNFSGPTATFNAETMKIIPGTSRTEITNENGNWDMGDGPGKEGVAFLITSNEVPVDTVGMHQSLGKEADEIESADDQSTFEVSNGSDGGNQVLSVTRTRTINGARVSSVYELDPVTGNLVSTLSSPTGGIRRDFDQSAAIDESAFNIPKSLVVAPVSDARGAGEYLYEQK